MYRCHALLCEAVAFSVIPTVCLYVGPAGKPFDSKLFCSPIGSLSSACPCPFDLLSMHDKANTVVAQCIQRRSGALSAWAAQKVNLLTFLF